MQRINPVDSLHPVYASSWNLRQLWSLFPASAPRILNPFGGPKSGLFILFPGSDCAGNRLPGEEAGQGKRKTGEEVGRERFGLPEHAGDGPGILLQEVDLDRVRLRVHDPVLDYPVPRVQDPLGPAVERLGMLGQDFHAEIRPTPDALDRQDEVRDFEI